MAKKDRRPWDSQLLHEAFGSVGSSFEPLSDVVSTLQEMFPNLSETQTLAGETKWRKFALIEEPDCTASHITDQDVSFTIVGT